MHLLPLVAMVTIVNTVSDREYQLIRHRTDITGPPKQRHCVTRQCPRTFVHFVAHQETGN